MQSLFLFHKSMCFLLALMVWIGPLWFSTFVISMKSLWANRLSSTEVTAIPTGWAFGSNSEVTQLFSAKPFMTFGSHHSNPASVLKSHYRTPLWEKFIQKATNWICIMQVMFSLTKRMWQKRQRWAMETTSNLDLQTQDLGCPCGPDGSYIGVFWLTVPAPLCPE